MHKLLHIVVDYAPGDLACSEVISAVAAHAPSEYHWHLSSVASFDTVSTGFVVGQLGLQERGLRPDETFIYANCAPRRDRKEARINNEGEGFLYGELDTGVRLLAVNSGYSLSFVRDRLKELWTVTVDNGGSQFRSRDNFPRLVGRALHGDLAIRVDRLDPLEVVPEPPSSAVAYVDSFGNLKTTIRDGDPILRELSPGQRVAVVINDVVMDVTVASGSFNVHEGDIALAPGSSGHGKKFWEIFQRGGSAYHTYRKPRPGAHITIRS